MVQRVSFPPDKTIHSWQWLWKLRKRHCEKSLPNAMFSFAAAKMHPFDLLCKHHYSTLSILSSLFVVRKDISGDAHDPLEDAKTVSRFRLLKSHYLWMPASEKSSVQSIIPDVLMWLCAGTRGGTEHLFLGRPWAAWAALFCCHLPCVQDCSPKIFCSLFTMLSSPHHTLNTFTKIHKHSRNRLPILMKIIISSGVQSVLPLGKG